MQISALLQLGGQRGLSMHRALGNQAGSWYLDPRIFWKRDLIIPKGHKELRGKQRKPSSIG